MVVDQVGRVALFSIHPRYADAILSGTKKVEFRRQGLPADVTHVVIYATAPVQRVVGAFAIEGIDRVAPTAAWSRYSDVGGIEEDPFFDYYDGAEAAFVIRVRDVTRFDAPVALADIEDGLRPPQSYMYLTDERLSRTLALGSGAHTATQGTNPGGVIERMFYRLFRGLSSEERRVGPVCRS
ncbi:ASCH domain-containing protein [Nocardioides jiangxiensis]|uniref:ASCH domain-containing protein n=1 Tax=Nocardioides jiangxiensis TaxID=3064524 RepID=A0ABT9AZY9_9ACTN|nr:ASCH domain-containing protein [Nocardioides sp. WY-20]MDO7868166.1 ASCH domain-containing protein [Nocardioides sp. WY-20]